MEADKLEKQLNEFSNNLRKMQDKIENQFSKIGWVMIFVALSIIVILALISNPSKFEHIAQIVDKNLLVPTV
ncbi:MAG: hypothetical protein AABZ60_03965, partial [Planctomycetota bacterium]